MLTKEEQIAQRARKFKDEALTNLHQFIDEDLLEDCYQSLNKVSSPGIDKETWYSYQDKFEQRCPELLQEFKSGTYRAPLIRRVYIPKNKTEKRPLGIPTIEDKIVQEGVRRVLNPIYEEEFKDFSYGFRQGHSAHQALDYMFKQVSFKGLRYIIDADIKGYFDNISHSRLREFLDKRVKDGVIRKMIDKWLKAGIFENKSIRYPEEGTPQGGIISPLLSNIYLHYVLDKWFEEEVQLLMEGRSFIVRYADDFVLGFEKLSDVKRVMEVLPKRFGKYELELHPDKTRIIDLYNNNGPGNRSFDFLGFPHYIGRSKRGNRILKKKTSSKKLSLALSRFRSWIKCNRHRKLKEILKDINTKLRGHYNYYGATHNKRGIEKYYYEVKRILQEWLNRRGGKTVWNWERFNQIIDECHLLLRPRIYHRYQKAKPI